MLPQIPSSEEFKKQSEVFVAKFLTQVYKVLEDKNLVLLIDEFDVLANHKKDAAINHFFFLFILDSTQTKTTVYHSRSRTATRRHAEPAEFI